MSEFMINDNGCRNCTICNMYRKLIRAYSESETLAKITDELNSCIEAIDDPVCKRILSLRIIQGLTIENIAFYYVTYSKRHIERLYNAGLNILDIPVTLEKAIMNFGKENISVKDTPTTNTASYDWANAWRNRMRKCPVCGKDFYPAPEHAYKIYISKTAEQRGDYKLVCTYSCMRKYEKEQEAKRKKPKTPKRWGE